MSLIGIVLIIIVVVCLIALICISRKRKALEDSFIKTTTPSKVRAEKSITSDAQKEEEKPLTGAQTIIYEYRASAGTRICPFCDGENSTSMKNCIICGRNLS